MMAGNGLVYPILGFVSLVGFIYMSFSDLRIDLSKSPSMSFVKRNGTHFIVEGRVFYVNGWNSYWLMDLSVNEDGRVKVRKMLSVGAKMGFSVCRTWAFSDGDHNNALQVSPGRFDERVFKALDYVIAEARRNGVRLILSLVNDLTPYGGKTQYVKWAWEEGSGLSSSNDSFFFDPIIRQYFKNYIEAILTRKNTITGIEYRDDPAIFAWELINEPHCKSDASGNTLQGWIKEMSAYVKSLDKNHLVTVGVEGFYGPTSLKRLNVNPSPLVSDLGSDFIRNSKVTTIDFASVHIYPDQWLYDEPDIDNNLKFVYKWMLSHIEDGDKELNKPVMFTEYGLSNLSRSFQPSHRDKFFKTVINVIYKSARNNQSGAGSFVWQFFVEGMEEYNDNYGFVPWQSESTYKLLAKHSCRLAAVQGPVSQGKNLKELCLRKQ